MDALPSITISDESVPSTQLLFSLDGSPTLDVSGDSILSHRDSNRVSILGDETHEDAIDWRSMISFSWTCGEVPGPLQPPGDGENDA